MTGTGRVTGYDRRVRQPVHPIVFPSHRATKHYSMIHFNAAEAVDWIILINWTGPSVPVSSSHHASRLFDSVARAIWIVPKPAERTLKYPGLCDEAQSDLA